MIEQRLEWPGGDYRAMVRALDECLVELEDAHERGETFVSATLVARLRSRLPWVKARMRITDALERVFDEQALHLPRTSPSPAPGHATAATAAAAVPAARAPTPAGRSDGAGRRAAPLDQLEARRLTERIKTAARQTCMLLREAHDRRAWVSLGYRTWEQYVRAEFGLSRRRSYDLLDQANVISAIQKAARTGAPPTVSAHAAVRIKGHLPMVTSIIRRRTAGLSEPEAHAVVDEVIRDVCVRASRDRDHRGRRQASGRWAAAAASTATVREAVRALAGKPAVAELVAAYAGDEASALLADARRACAWLTELLWSWPDGGTGHEPWGDGGRPQCADFRTRRHPDRIPGAWTA